MGAATEGNLPPVMPQGNLVEVLGREVRQGAPAELMMERSPSRQRRQPCKTSKEVSDEAADAAALTTYYYWERKTQRMWKEWVAKWRITKKAKRRRGEDGEAREEALGRGAREKARPGILLCAPLGLKGQRESPDFDLQSCPFCRCERRNVNRPKSFFTPKTTTREQT